MTAGAALVACGYAAYLLSTYWTGALYFYIHPFYIVPTVVTALVLLALAVAAGAPGPAPEARRASPIGIALLALPLALGFALPAQPLSPLAAGQRGVELASLPGEAPPTLALGARPETYTIKDWVKAFQADPEPSRHTGKPVRVTGFVHREDQLRPGWFLVSRFVVKCCAVDAQPVGLPVRASAGAAPEPGRWVTVEGAWEVSEAGGERRAVIAARSIRPTERPDQPYLY